MTLARELVRTLAAFLLLASIGCRTDAGLTIYAAASFTELSQALADSFSAVHPGIKPRISVGSSSVLARQIESGAPADVFLSADIRWVEHLDSLRLVERSEVPDFTNRLAVFYRANEATYETPGDLRQLSRIAVGDPDHVPAGRYARQALECLGLWDDIEDNIVPAVDTRASLHTLRTGATPAAIGYYSDARVVEDPIQDVALSGDCAPDIRCGAATLAVSPRPQEANVLLSFIPHDDQRSTWLALGFQEATR